MPVTWSIGDGLVRIESDEEAAFEDWREALDAALASRDYRHGTPVLHDLRRMKRLPSATEAQQRIDVIVSRAKVFGYKRWAAIVAGAAGYGVGRMAEALADGAPVAFRAFKDPAEAEAWARGGD